LKPSVILMGSKPGSIVALRLMIQRGWDIKYVVTTPEINHHWIDGPSLTEEAERLGLPVCTQDTLSSDISADFVISYMFRKLVRPQVIAQAKRGALNFHAGPLPRFGGWAFYNVAILESASEYGCTCHYMDEGFDTGPLLRVNTFPINPAMHTAVSLESAAQAEMVRLFIDVMDMAESGDPLPCLPQQKEQMRYLSKSEFMKLKEIPADADAETVDRYARAFWYPPYECAYLNTGFARAEVVPQIAKEECGKLLHHDALVELLQIAQEYKESKIY
jgi:methionyl-tRNA formyltransferase